MSAWPIKSCVHTRVFIFLAAGFVLPGLLAAQTLFQVRNLSSTLVVRISSIDPSTGTSVTIVDISGISFPATTVAYDPLQRRLFFIASSGPGLLVRELFVVNTETGASARFPTDLTFELAFDPITRLLYGLLNDSGQVLVRSIDPATGTTTTVAAVPGTSNSAGAAAFDPVSGRFFFFSSSSGRLFTASVRDGTFSSVPAAMPLAELHYDSAAGQLHGLSLASRPVNVLTIDPSSGNVLATYPTSAPSILLAQSAYDEVGKRFFLISSAMQLYTVHLPSGAVSIVPVSSEGEIIYGVDALISVPLFSTGVQITLAVALLAFALMQLRR